MIFFFAFLALAMYSLASSTSPAAGVHGEPSGTTSSRPGMPSGVKLSAGFSFAWVMLSMIDWRSTASDIARRWFTSVMFSLTLKP